MKTLYRVAVWTGCMGILFSGIPSAYAGKSEGRIKPPAEAQALLSGFQQALRDSRWDKALSLCSDRVRAEAGSYPSAEMFFRQVVPVGPVVALESFPMYSYTTQPGPEGKLEPDGFTTIGQCVQISRSEPDPPVYWRWTLLRLDKTWIIDFEPKSLGNFIEEEVSRLKKGEEDQRELIGLADHVITRATTRLTALHQPYTIGQPKRFRLELVNECDFDIVYEPSQVAVNDPMFITDARGNRVLWTGGPVQTVVHYDRIKKGETKILFDNLDISEQYPLDKPGCYKIQFGGQGLTLGIPAIPRQDIRYERPSSVSSKKFPSNVVEIEVQASAPSK